MLLLMAKTYLPTRVGSARVALPDAVEYRALWKMILSVAASHRETLRGSETPVDDQLNESCAPGAYTSTLLSARSNEKDPTRR